MLRWFQALMPREDRFFVLYNRHATTLVRGAESLCDLLRGGPGVAEAARRIAGYEEEADAIARELLLLARRTFITPFDRADMKDLMNSLDDTIDEMKKTAKSVVLFEVDTLEPEMTEMGEHILRAAKLTVDAVALLPSMRADAAKLNAITEEIIRLEDDTDTLNDRGIKQLFLRHRDSNAMTYIVGTEIFGRLERVMDRFESAAHRISGLVIEQM